MILLRGKLTWRWPLVLVVLALLMPLTGCGPIHWLLPPGACHECGVMHCAIHRVGPDETALAAPRPRFHPVPTRPVFTAGYIPANQFPDAVQETAPWELQGEGPADRLQSPGPAGEPRSEKIEDADAQQQPSDDDALRHQTAARQPPRIISPPEGSRPVPMLEPPQNAQPRIEDSGELQWRGRESLR